VIWMPAPFRARITDPPTPAFDGDDCNPQGIPRPSDEHLAALEAAEELLSRALPFTPGGGS
jgi:hypothetical protein